MSLIFKGSNRLKERRKYKIFIVYRKYITNYTLWYKIYMLKYVSNSNDYI